MNGLEEFAGNSRIVFRWCLGDGDLRRLMISRAVLYFRLAVLKYFFSPHCYSQSTEYQRMNLCISIGRQGACIPTKFNTYILPYLPT